MVDQLNFAPCGYLIIDRDGLIQTMNMTLKKMLGSEKEADHIHTLLTAPSRLYFQTYFLPLLDVKGQVNEIYLTLNSEVGKMPVLMNAVEREIAGEKRNLKRTLKETDEANITLQRLLREVEEKQSELEMLNEQLQQLVLTDGLTGIANRRHFDEQLTSLVGRFQQDRELFSIILLDIDYFKKVNDSLGHQIGDFVLQKLSLKLQSIAVDKGFVARIGGEEFAVLLPRMGEKEAYRWAERLRRTVEQSAWLHTPITVSIGVTEVREGDENSAILKRVDEALYVSKKSGRNRVSCALPVGYR